MKKLTIELATWDRGNKATSLLNHQTGKKCCLGFFCLQAGMAEHMIVGYARPERAMGIWKDTIAAGKIFKNLELMRQEDFVSWAIFINDNSTISDQERQIQLKKFFAAQGVEVEYI